MPTFLMTVPAASFTRVTRMFDKGYQRNSSAPQPAHGAGVQRGRSSTGGSSGDRLTPGPSG
ncbi:MAG: hypothetical protein KDE06_16440, partial [Rhodobacteraceae bacterium]|nr:hypothetical protein [Paracoccaceae bacterium]